MHSSSVPAGTTTFPVTEARGLHTGFLWDDANDVLLWSQAPVGSISQIVTTAHVRHPERRRFWTGDGAKRVPSTVELTATNTLPPIGRPAGLTLDDWSRRRIYDHERAVLKANRTFVQYVPSAAGHEADKERALDDLRALIAAHGTKATWLWDPYLSADDILRTLFHSPHFGADLRALTDAAEVPGQGAPAVPSFADRQRAVFAGNAGNCEGLKLEYRARIGHQGWSFHDRFLIFPDTPEGPQAWSLGTSVNALGHRHHILQRVGDAQLVADAFSELWDQLNQPLQLVWKTP